MTVITDDTPDAALNWLERYGIHSDGSVEEDALSSRENQEWFALYIQILLQSPESTQQTRVSCAHSWLQWIETRGLIASEVVREHLFQYVDGLVATELGDAAIGNRVDTCVAMYEWASNRGHIDENPFTGFKLEDEYKVKRNFPIQVRILRDRGDEKEDDAIVAIGPDMVEELIEHSGSPRLRNQLVNRLLWQTGLRASELASVTLGDIEQDERSIRVRSAKTPIDEELAYRTVYYQENLEYSMWEWLEGGGRKGLNSSVGDDDDEYLLVTQQSEKMRPSHISRIVKESAQRAGINEVLYVDAAGKNRWLITGHTLRHSMITFCANGDPRRTDSSGMPLHLLRKISGHKSLDTTLRYISDSKKERKNALERYGPR